MTENTFPHRPEVYAHLKFLIATETEGWPPGHEVDAEFALMEEYCLAEGLAHTVPTGFAHGGTYYRATARGKLALRDYEGLSATEEIPNEATVAPDKVPAEYREHGKSCGEILTSAYLISKPEWPFKESNEFTRAYEAGKLTRRIKVGRTYAYLYTELAALWRDNSLKP